VKLQTRLLLLLLPLIVGPFLLLGGIAYKRMSAEVQSLLTDQIANTLTEVENHTLSRIESAEANVHLFSNSNLLENYLLINDEEERYTLLQPALLRLFDTYQRAYPEYVEIRVLLPDGYEDTRMVSVDMPNQTEDEGGSDLFKRMASSRSPAFSTFFEHPDMGKTVFLVARKIRLSDNEFDPVGPRKTLRGYLAVTMDVGFMEKHTQTSRIGEEGSLLYADSQGMVLFHRNPDRVGKKLPPALLETVGANREKGSLFSTTLWGRKVLVQARKLHSQLFLIALLPESEWTKATRTLGAIVAGITLVTIAVTFGVLFWVIKFYCIDPIRRISQAVVEVGKGELGVRLTVDRSDEIGALASEFNHMTDMLGEVTVSRDYVDRILNSMSAAVIVLTSEGAIETVNESVCRHTGYTREELIGRPLETLFQHEDLQWIDQLKTQGEMPNIEMTMLSKEGGGIPVLFSGSIMTARDDEISGTTCVFKDITALKAGEKEKLEMEKKLQRAKKMEAIAVLAGGMAHDLNNILSGVVSYPELILLDLPEDNPMRTPIQSIKRSGEKAAAIVNDLLLLARRGVAVTAVVNLNTIVAEYLDSPEFRNLLGRHENIEMDCRLEEGLRNMKGSPVHLSKVVMNLVTNAAEAMPGGGTLLVTTENRYVDRPYRGYEDVEAGEFVVLTVADSGIGISKEDQERIFDPFYTSKVMGRNSGSGLGMSVVWGTVKDHEGYIDVQSAAGEGSTFTLFFPASQQKEKQIEAVPDIDSLMGRGQSILVVDDVLGQRQIAVGLLTRLGYRAESVSSGEQAIEFISKTPVELLLLDMIMDPGIDGLDTYRRVIELRPGQKAIIASGYAETTRVMEALALGAGKYLKKPYSLTALGLAVKQVLEKT
jgi:PAS domain S-box-containing protein